MRSEDQDGALGGGDSILFFWGGALWSLAAGDEGESRCLLDGTRRGRRTHSWQGSSPGILQRHARPKKKNKNEDEDELTE